MEDRLRDLLSPFGWDCVCEINSNHYSLDTADEKRGMELFIPDVLDDEAEDKLLACVAAIKPATKLAVVSWKVDRFDVIEHEHVE